MPDDKNHPLSSENLFKAIGAAFEADQEEQEAWEKDPDAYRFGPDEGIVVERDNDDVISDLAEKPDVKKMTREEYGKHLEKKGLNRPTS